MGVPERNRATQGGRKFVLICAFALLRSVKHLWYTAAVNENRPVGSGAAARERINRGRRILCYSVTCHAMSCQDLTNILCYKFTTRNHKTPALA